MARVGFNEYLMNLNFNILNNVNQQEVYFCILTVKASPHPTHSPLRMSTSLIPPSLKITPPPTPQLNVLPIKRNLEVFTLVLSSRAPVSD